VGSTPTAIPGPAKTPRKAAESVEAVRKYIEHQFM
jgi:hypothetical protein